ncbi:glycosyltransferase [Streptomyces atratus]
MIIWLNGPFGGGKSTLAANLREALPGTVVAGPEAVDDVPRTALAGHALRPRDYQDPDAACGHLMNRPDTSTVPPHFPVVHVVLLTMNDRPDQERAAQATLLAQKGVELRICVVGNGYVPDIVPAGACTVVLKENVGIPGGRNAGARALAESGRPGDYLFFLDNDATFPADDVLARLVAEADQHPDAAYVQPRLTGPDDATTPRRWVPRLRAGSAARPGVITTMTEGVILVRRNIFDALGGWEATLFLYHDGLDLAYRCWSAGYASPAGPGRGRLIRSGRSLVLRDSTSRSVENGRLRCPGKNRRSAGRVTGEDKRQAKRLVWISRPPLDGRYDLAHGIRSRQWRWPVERVRVTRPLAMTWASATGSSYKHR